MNRLALTIKITAVVSRVIEINTEAKVSELKEAIQSASNNDFPASRQRLVHGGTVLTNERTLESYGIKNGHTIHLIIKAEPKTVIVVKETQ